MSEGLGERIRRIRLRYGMSQAELARRIKVSLTTMNKIEAGDTPDPRASRISAIADVLGVSADVLLGRKDEESEFWPPLWPWWGPRPTAAVCFWPEKRPGAQDYNVSTQKMLVREDATRCRMITTQRVTE